jgi:hypothetical protein
VFRRTVNRHLERLSAHLATQKPYSGFLIHLDCNRVLVIAEETLEGRVKLLLLYHHKARSARAGKVAREVAQRIPSSALEAFELTSFVYPRLSYSDEHKQSCRTSVRQTHHC